MGAVKWIKLNVDLFDNRKIRQIESLPDADGIIIVWIKLLCLAGVTNDGGKIYLTKNIPYNAQMLSAFFKRPLNSVQYALSIFRDMEMITDADGIIKITNWERYQNIEGLEKIREQTRNRVKKHRESKQLLQDCNDVTLHVTQCNATEEEEEREEEEEQEYFLFENNSIWEQLTPDERLELISEYKNVGALICLIDKQKKGNPEKPYSYIRTVADRMSWEKGNR